MTGRMPNCITARMNLRSLCLALGCFCLYCVACHADSVNVTLPPSVSFMVTDITQSTTGNPSPTAVTFTDYAPGGGSNLHISIQSSAADFTKPGDAGTAIPAAKLSWNAGSPSAGGATFSGTLSAVTYTEVYHGNAASNSFDLTWTLAPLDPTIRAGTHALVATWKVESL